MRRFLSRFFGSFVISASVATVAGAQSLESCDWVASAANLVEPWAETTRSYGDGAIRIALLDTGGEPVCCSMHLLILSPGEYGQACHVLSAQAGTGFREVLLENVESRYDAGKGLLLSVPVGDFDPDTGGVDQGSIRPVRIRINQSTGAVVLEAAAPSQSIPGSAQSASVQGAKK
jgi:hypothetical protein